jgi:organic hydroperoxide reductase OsmC/OhrA
MAKLHTYTTEVTWTGNRGEGTVNFRSYDRLYDTSSPGRPIVAGSADPAVVARGSDASRWNPELMLLAALSQCHMLAYLHHCSVNGVVVTAYSDAADGTLEELPGTSGGHFTEAVLRPRVEVAEAGMTEKAIALHANANASCFIASSVNFPVRHEPLVTVAAYSG